MASSSVSQEDVENDFELSSRRSRIRTARARTVNPTTRVGEIDDSLSEMKVSESLNIGGPNCGEHDASPKPLSRTKEKRVNRNVPVRQPLADHLNRPNHLNKGKQPRDRRKLREKRRSTGVVHLPSTESTGGSTGEDEGDVLSITAETRRNTIQNEHLTHESVPEERAVCKTFPQRRSKRYNNPFTVSSNAQYLLMHSEIPLLSVFNPSDLEADDEDNQDLDSLNQSDSTVSSVPQCRRPGTPTGENPEELLERAQEENRRLLSLLEDRDHKINVLEQRITQLQRDMAAERERLRDENAALIRAMASLAAN
ncbi:PRKC apoptosis WT1 regulator protein-like isoform X2 [Thrips palmi]|uniref:PRKC apoptosis WT1 regulator protein-like isoform X2 n=1 Tax=Thrips palmi TaxID=161013 RepID=A0A6P8ZIM5_THRPL|nr:PRKC apoptosis WT1 regulator protein-like isoform X2 [Thrips palmi]